MKLFQSAALAAAICGGVFTAPALADFRIEFIDRIMATQAFAPACEPREDFREARNQSDVPFLVQLNSLRACDGLSAAGSARHETTTGVQVIRFQAECSAAAVAEESATLEAASAVIFRLDFSLTEVQPYTLAGYMRSEGGLPLRVSGVSLSGQQGMIHQFEHLGRPADPARLDFLARGTLPPGNYTLLATAQANVLDFENDDQVGMVMFDGALIASACIGDSSGDNAVGLQDLATMLANFGRADGARLEDGDLTGDGAITLADLARFLALFGSTCD